MSVVLCNLFRLNYEREHSEKVSECPLCARASPRCELTEADCDITRRAEVYVDEKRSLSNEHVGETLQASM